MSSDSKIYDVVVIGGGTAGSNAARAALSGGAKSVLLVHLPELLNTCVERGCMPSKSIIHSSADGVSFNDAVERMDGHITRLAGYLHESLKNEKGLDIVEGKASFLGDDKGISIAQEKGEKTLRGERYVIAVGSSSFIPPLEGLDSLPERLVLTSDDVVSLKHIHELPKSIFILGGGPIGLEMMTVFANFGTRVIVAERGELLTRMDPEFGKEMKKAIGEMENVTLLSPSNFISVKTDGDGIVCTVESNGKTEEYEAEKLLVATGRRAVLDSLQVENVGLTLLKGRLNFDEKTLQTDNPNIYIAGDVTGTYQILHYASAMGNVAGHNAAVGAGEKSITYEELNMGIIFSEPQVGNIGLTESTAKEKGIEVVSSMLDIPNMGRGLLENKTVGIWKLIVQKSDGRIVGAQAIGASPHSEWFIDVIAWLIHFKATASDLREKVPYYHPTWPELLQSMGRELCKKLGEKSDETISPGN